MSHQAEHGKLSGLEVGENGVGLNAHHEQMGVDFFPAGQNGIIA